MWMSGGDVCIQVWMGGGGVCILVWMGGGGVCGWVMEVVSVSWCG